jgi:hypothetical protein
MIMIRTMAILLMVSLAGQCLALELKQDECWSGRINLDQDVIVPEGYTITIAPGTKVITNGNRIISYGTVNIWGEAENTVNFQYFPLNNTSSIEVIKMKPYNIDTQILKEEFNTFKVQYAILWSLLFASTFLMLEARR